MRTSVTFPEPLLYRLKVALAEDKKSMTAFVVELVEKALAAREQSSTRKAYEAMDKLVGTGPKGITNASTTINETLYGEQGAWRDNHGE